MALERRSDAIARLEAVLQGDTLGLRAGSYVPLDESFGLFMIGRPEATHSGSRGRVYVLTAGEREEESRGGSYWRVTEDVEVVISELFDHAQDRIDQKLGLADFGESVTRALCEGLSDSWQVDQTVMVRESVTGDGYEVVVPGRLSYLHDMAAA